MGYIIGWYYIIIIRGLMDDYRAADNIFGRKSIREKRKFRDSVTWDKNRKIAGVVSVWLLVRVPMSFCVLKWSVACIVAAFISFVNMKPEGRNLRFAVFGRAKWRQARNIGINPCSAVLRFKLYRSAKSWSE